MMNEKIAVAVVVNAETAKRIEREVMRQAFVAELMDLKKRMTEAGFSWKIVGTADPNQTMFGTEVQIPAAYFTNRKTNEYNMGVNY